MPRRSLVFAVTALGVALLVPSLLTTGCGGSDNGSTGNADASTPTDGAQTSDASPASDSSAQDAVSSDDSSAQDASSSDDSSPPPDAKPPADACASPPTTSVSLSRWPQLTPVTGADWTAMASPTTASVTAYPAGVLVTHDGGWVLAAVNGTDADGGTIGALTVLKRSGATLTFDHAIPAPAGEQPFGIALSPDGKTVAMSMSSEVALYDLAKAETDPANALLGYAPTQSQQKVGIDVVFSRDGKLLFVANEYDNDVAVINVAQRAYIGAIPIAGDSVTGLAVSPDGATLYVICEEASEFALLNPNPAADQVVGKITVVSVATAASNPAIAIVGEAFVGRAPVRVAVSPDGATVWVTARGSNALLALDAKTLLSTTCSPLLASIAVGPAPVGLSFVDQGKAVAVADSNRFAQPLTNETVAFVDAKAKTVLGHVMVGMFPREIDDDATALFVSNYASNSISGVDLTKLPLP